MKNLNLNKRQKLKLIEMVRTLFPEYKIQHYSGVIQGHLKWIFTNPTLEKKHERGYIHWFEFCIIYLPPKIFNGKRDFLELSDWQIFRLSDFSKKHPVDYLYEQFKQLENGTNTINPESKRGIA